MEIDDRSAKEHIHRWTKAWNDHNVKEVLSLYSENILFSSPKVKSVYPNWTSATITNKKDLEEYFCWRRMACDHIATAFLRWPV